MTPLQLRGVYPVFQTPFDDSERVDLEELEREIEWIALQGVHGIVLGMVSEVLRLTDAERRSVLITACRAAAAFGLPCIASVGAESTAAALARVDDALEAGAAGLMATPPLNGRNDERSLETYFGSILRHSQAPVVVQDASGYVGQSLSIDMQARLFQEFGGQVMFKPEAVPIGPTLDALLRATGGGATVIEGMGGAALLETYPAGVSGSMPGAEVCWAVVAMWTALEAGDAAAAEVIHRPLSQMIALQEDLDSFVVCEKYLLVEQGVLSTSVARTPLRFALDADSRRALRASLEELREAVAKTSSGTRSVQR
jgi:dihydrodipicolinate synthase/N-acetylneuraminate lyase